MSELHTYRIHVVVAPGRSAMRYETAFSAADALTQFRLPHWREEVYKIEPLPDSPSVPDERAEAQLDEMAAKLRDAEAGSEAFLREGLRLATELRDAKKLHHSDVDRLVQDGLRLAAERDRIRVELHAVTEQRDGAREALGASDRELREDRAQAKRLREERDALQKRIDAAGVNLNAAAQVRMGLEKRIEAALPVAREMLAWQDGCVDYGGEQTSRRLLAILEGREP